MIPTWFTRTIIYNYWEEIHFFFNDFIYLREKKWAKEREGQSEKQEEIPSCADSLMGPPIPGL